MPGSLKRQTELTFELFAVSFAENYAHQAVESHIYYI